MAAVRAASGFSGSGTGGAVGCWGWCCGGAIGNPGRSLVPGVGLCNLSRLIAPAVPLAGVLAGLFWWLPGEEPLSMAASLPRA